MPSKYRAVKTVVDGFTFSSKSEARRWSELKLLERAGQISGLERQVAFPLAVNGVHICKYVADFCYTERGHRRTEDVKGMKTPLYALKKRLMFAIHHIEIQEVNVRGRRNGR